MKNTCHLFLFTFILFSSLCIRCKNPEDSSDLTIYEEMEQEVHQLVNAHRTSMGLAALEWNEDIAEQCRNHSRNMAETGIISHDGFEERIENLHEILSFAGCGENAAQNRSAQGAVQSWLNSTGHRNNIEGGYNLTGVGVALRGTNTYFFTQLFIDERKEIKD